MSLSLDWTMVAGSGFVAAVLLAALVERLRRTFVTRRELATLARRLGELEARHARLRDAAEEARGELGELRADQRHQWERVNERAIRPLERATEKLQAMGEIQAAQAVILDELSRRVHRDGPSLSRPFPERVTR
jgi:hypothetical protein